MRGTDLSKLGTDLVRALSGQPEGLVPLTDSEREEMWELAGRIALRWGDYWAQATDVQTPASELREAFHALIRLLSLEDARKNTGA